MTNSRSWMRMGRPQDKLGLHRKVDHIYIVRQSFPITIEHTDWGKWNLCIHWRSYMVIFTAGNTWGMSLNECIFGYYYRLPAHTIGMVVDRGQDFPPSTQTKLDSYGSDMWLFRDHSDVGTTRAINSYKGDERRFSSGISPFCATFNY